MGIVFDLVFIAIIVAVIVISKNKGFVASCLDTLSLIISSVVSFLFTKQVADAVYNFAVRNLVKTSLKDALDEIDQLEKTALDRTVFQRYREYFPPFLFAGALLVLAAVSLQMAASRRLV